ncbi:MAG: hypothetical protein WKG07_49810 [Hymenobacter sp.]
MQQAPDPGGFIPKPPRTMTTPAPSTAPACAKPPWAGSGSKPPPAPCATR